jgi:RimJ/RimL family protein N-acetyltransferase
MASATRCGIMRPATHPGQVDGPPADDGARMSEEIVEDPASLLELFGRDREVHPYGIADVEQLWECSRWWRDDDAAVGVIQLPGSPVPVVYAVSAQDPAGTLDLLDRLDATGALPRRFVITGPRGLADRLSRHAVRWSRWYDKLALRHPELLPPPSDEVVTLDGSHLVALQGLYGTDPDAGDFFHPALLDTGFYLGVLRDGEVLASAGIHVIDRRNGVAAIGNVATNPDHRGRGLARLVTGTLCHHLLAVVEHVGLNVSEGNLAAAALYRRLGFVPVLPYEEAELG